MNSTPFPSSIQSLFNPSTKPPIPSFHHHHHPSLKFHNTHLKTSQIPFRPPTATSAASASAAAANGSYVAAADAETLYDLLGISESGTLSDIKRAYKQMALKYHPDVSPPDRAEEYTSRFIRVREAYETLSDPEARSVYDRSMAEGLWVAFSGKRGPRFDPGSDDKRRWRDTWEGQVSELMRRSRAKARRPDPADGASWATRIRNQRSGSGVNGSGQQEQ